MIANLSPVPLIFADADGNVLSPDGDVCVEAVAAVGVGSSLVYMAVTRNDRPIFEGMGSERPIRLEKEPIGPASAFKGYGRGIDAIRLTVSVPGRGRAA